MGTPVIFGHNEYMKIKIFHFKSNQKGLFLFKNQHTVEKLQFQRINHIHNSFYLFFYSESKKKCWSGSDFEQASLNKKKKGPKMFLCHWFFSSWVSVFVNWMNDFLRVWTILKDKASKFNLYLNCIFTFIYFQRFLYWNWAKINSHFCSSALNTSNKKRCTVSCEVYGQRCRHGTIYNIFLFTHDFEMVRAQNWKRVDF